MRKYLSIALLSIFLFNSCKKDPVPIVRMIPDDLRAYWDFKTGTWWAYKDSVTGAIDTVNVTDRVNYTFDGKLSYNNAAATCEYLQITTYNTGDEYTYKYWISTDWSSGDIKDFNVVSSEKFKSGDFVDTHICFLYPFNLGNYTGNYYGIFDSVFVKNIYSNYNGNYNVVNIESSHNSFEGYSMTHSFYSKSIGLIQYNVPDSNKFKSLISYFIQP